MRSAAINDLDFFLVEVPSAPVRSLVVRLTDEHGLEGWGEAVSTWRPSETPARRDAILPAVAGRSIFDIEELLTLELFADAALRCAMEMASWDLVGRVLDQPVYDLMGGAYRRRIPVAVRVEASSDGKTVQLARQLADQGFHSLVIPATGDLDRDADLPRRVRENAGTRVDVRLDAGQRYDVETAAELCARLENGCVEFLVDPVPVNDPSELQPLQRRTTISLAARRCIRGPKEVLHAVGKETAGLIVVDLRTVGGILPARKCAAVAEAAGAAACLAQGPDLGLSTAAMLQVAACTPAFTYHNETAHKLFDQAILAEPFDIGDGMLAVPQGPGLGIRVDREKVEQLQVG